MPKSPLPVKVVHIITELETGGAEMMLYKLLSRMDRRQVCSQVVSLQDLGTIGDPIQALGIPVHTLGMEPGRPSLSALIRLVRLLRRERPHIVQTWLYHADLFGLVAAKLADIPRLAWNLRCSDMEMQHYSFAVSGILKILSRLAAVPTAVLVNSAAGRQLHESLGYRPRQWIQIPNGFDLDRFQPQAEQRASVLNELGIPNDAVLIGLIARYDPMKDHTTFMGAATALLESHPQTHFVLVGLGVKPDNPALTSQVEATPAPGHFHLLGERKDIPRILNALDIASNTSAFGEGFSNAIGEAMACGVPCVTTDVGDSAAIVGETGRIVPPRHPGALLEAWRSLIEVGDEGRQALGVSARKRIEREFSLDAVAARYEHLYTRDLR